MLASEKQAWIDALRSGKYEQGHGVLRRRDEYCCLGVYADAVLHCEWSIDKRGSMKAIIGEQRCLTYLPLDILSQNIQKHLANMNDSDEPEYDFNAIADWIEDNVDVDIN